MIDEIALENPGKRPISQYKFNKSIKGLNIISLVYSDTVKRCFLLLLKALQTLTRKIVL
jgi:hypothetical protein